jgi:hypothetical protein
MTIYAHVSLDEKRKALSKLGEARPSAFQVCSTARPADHHLVGPSLDMR